MGKVYSTNITISVSIYGYDIPAYTYKGKTLVALDDLTYEMTDHNEGVLPTHVEKGVFSDAVFSFIWNGMEKIEPFMSIKKCGMPSQHALWFIYYFRLRL